MYFVEAKDILMVIICSGLFAYCHMLSILHNFATKSLKSALIGFPYLFYASVFFHVTVQELLNTFASYLILGNSTKICLHIPVSVKIGHRVSEHGSEGLLGY